MFSPVREALLLTWRTSTCSTVKEETGESDILGMSGSQELGGQEVLRLGDGPQRQQCVFRRNHTLSVHLDCCCFSSYKVGQYQLKLIYNDKSVRQKSNSLLMSLPEFDTPGEFEFAVTAVITFA